MFADLLLFATACFVLGLKSARTMGAIINKIYAEHFYVPKIKLRASVIGDCEVKTAAILKIDQSPVDFTVEMFSFRHLVVEMDAVSTKIDFSKTRMYLHDSAAILPYKTSYNKDKSVFTARYLLPRPLPESKSLDLWFFN